MTLPHLQREKIIINKLNSIYMVCVNICEADLVKYVHCYLIKTCIFKEKSIKHSIVISEHTGHFLNYLLLSYLYSFMYVHYYTCNTSVKCTNTRSLVVNSTSRIGNIFAINIFAIMVKSTNLLCKDNQNNALLHQKWQNQTT